MGTEDKKKSGVDTSESSSTQLTNKSSPAYVNSGLELWERERLKWKSPPPSSETGEGSTTSNNSSSQPKRRVTKWATDINIDEVIDMIFSSRWKKAVERNSEKRALDPNSTEADEGAFPEAVPLPQMVDILVDLWEAEGLEI